MIDTRTGERKITERGPVISDAMAKAMMLPNNALKRVETTLPFEVIDTEGDNLNLGSPRSESMFDAYR